MTRQKLNVPAIAQGRAPKSARRFFGIVYWTWGELRASGGQGQTLANHVGKSSIGTNSIASSGRRTRIKGAAVAAAPMIRRAGGSVRHRRLGIGREGRVDLDPTQQ